MRARRASTSASIVNVPESTIARESDVVFPTLCGPEIGVASTKAFTAQLTVLAALAIARRRGARHARRARRSANWCGRWSSCRAPCRQALAAEAQIERIAKRLSKAKDVLYLGRGPLYPLAMEGALKLKEISYIHAEGYAAGELKHGPIALIDEDMPVIVIAPSDDLFEKTALQHAGGRRARRQDHPDHRRGGRAAIGQASPRPSCPQGANFVAPIVALIPVQLLAYHTAVAMGTDVDQPRNLAKSVTVE